MKDKSSLRAYYLGLLKKQKKKERVHKSLIIAEQLWKLPAMKKARTILFYASLPGEVDTWAMIKKALLSGKRVALPIVKKDQRKLIPAIISSMKDVHNGTYDIAQPHFDPQKVVSLKDIDAVVVPGLAFDRFNNRLGRGKGYYDRFLSRLSKTTTTVGLAFDFQITDCLPTMAHDWPLQHIIAG